MRCGRRPFHHQKTARAPPVVPFFRRRFHNVRRMRGRCATASVDCCPVTSASCRRLTFESASKWYSANIAQKAWRRACWVSPKDARSVKRDRRCIPISATDLSHILGRAYLSALWR